MSQDKLIIIYTIIHSVILIGIIGAEIIKEKKGLFLFTGLN